VVIPDAAGNTPLHYAMRSKLTSAIPALVEHGALATLQMTNKSDFTPIDEAHRNSIDLSAYDLDQYATCSHTRFGDEALYQAMYSCRSCSVDCCDVCSVRCHAALGHKNVTKYTAHEVAGGSCDCPATGSCKAEHSAQMPGMRKPKKKQTLKASSAPMAVPLLAASPDLAQTALIQMMQQLLEKRVAMESDDAADDGDKKKPKDGGKAAAPPPRSTLVNVLILVVGLFALAFFGFVLVNTMYAGIEEAREVIRAEKAHALSAYNVECVRANMSKMRSIATYMTSVNATGHLVGDATCEAYKTQMARDADKFNHFELKIFMRKLAESVNVFVSSLSAKSWAMILWLREGMGNLIGHATTALGAIPGFSKVVKVGKALLSLLKHGFFFFLDLSIYIYIICVRA
jgi:hypothetical protein